MSKKPWNSCDECGRFIPYQDFADGHAQRLLATPSSEFSDETYDTFCKMHKATTSTEPKP